MSKYRDQLPQLSDAPFITDGGLETTLIFEHGYDLPELAAFDLLSRPGGYEVLRDYFGPYARLAREHQVGFILESPTWRASRHWGRKLGYTGRDLRDMNRKAIAMLADIRRSQESGKTQMVISGCIGPRGDGYQVSSRMTAEEAKSYHFEQIQTFSETEADLVSAFTLNYAEEAAGIVRAAQKAQIPSVIGFTVESDGRLPSGQELGEAIVAVDHATDSGPAYYMINCAHPTHFADVLNRGGSWVERIRAIRPNASAKSHAELDESVELDTGDPIDLGTRCAELAARFPHLNVFGGCCGTDLRHVTQICQAGTLGTRKK
jgi:S-methylmethionine-dependent homocysteine/selenocysteine methylase